MGGSPSATTRSWNSGDFTNRELHIKLDGVTVTINRELAFVSYIIPTQINCLIPADFAAGPGRDPDGEQRIGKRADIGHARKCGAGLLLPGEKEDQNFIAALQADNSPALIVTPGEPVALYETGFGATMPAVPNGQLLSSPLPLVQPVQVTIGGLSVELTFSGLVAPGLYQLIVIVPKIDPKYHLFGVPDSCVD